MMHPGLASWAKFSRPCGTKLVNPGSHTLLSPPFELKGDGTNGFQVLHDGLPTRRGRCPQVVVPSCQRPTHGKRTPGRTPAHRAIIYSLCGLVAGRRNPE